MAHGQGRPGAAFAAAVPARVEREIRGRLVRQVANRHFQCKSSDLLTGLQPVLVQFAEKDVLPVEGEAYARKRDAAGVSVRGDAEATLTSGQPCARFVFRNCAMPVLWVISVQRPSACLATSQKPWPVLP